MKALVTGASEGIGKAISLALAEKGYDLILCARRIDLLSLLKAEINKKHPRLNVAIFSIDFLINSQVLAFLKQLETANHYPDVLVNNVGMFAPAGMLAESDEEFLKTFQVNFFSAYLLSKWCAKHMSAKKEGYIFSVVSVGAKKAVPGAGSYSISKFALHGLMVNLREELKTSGIKVTSILPGATLTSSWKGSEQVKHSPESFIQPEDIAKALISCLNMSPGANIDEFYVNPLNFSNGS